MAAEGSSPEVEVKVHRKSYDLFTWLMKWGTIISAIVAFLVILIIAS